MTESISGKVITFYSYKGGTGRSMALANVGALLAQQGSNRQSVLLIDWDLEAPGLHRFFEDQISRKIDFKSQLGLIDFFYELQQRFEAIGDDEKAELKSASVFENLPFEKNYVVKTSIPSLFLMTAGRFDDNYPSRVNSFNWEGFFNRFPWAIRKFAEYLANSYRYILVDSRTGYTDTSGVCTTLMPEKLVVVFTPNRQSLTGVLDLVKNATDYRKQSDDLRPLIVYPLASRVEPSEPKLREDWRLGNSRKRIPGYQQQFEDLLERVYALPKCDLKQYFDEVQIQQSSHYAYGEEIAILTERADDRFSLTRSYENLTERLILLDGPWENLEVDAEKEKDFDTVERTDSTTRKLRVFLSYASADRTKALELYERLRREGFEPWIDTANLLPGQDWTREIYRAVENSDVIIVLLSKNSVRTEGYVQKELRYALDVADKKPDGTIFIIPLKIEETEVPRALASIHWVNYYSEEKEDGYRQLALALNRRAKALGISI